jgi:ATP-grasp domain
MKKKQTSGFRILVRSRHPSHDILRQYLPVLPFKSGIRLGSTTVLPDETVYGGTRIVLNSVESVRNSSNKARMKQCFNAAGVCTAEWQEMSQPFSLSFPVVVKHIFGSRGRGNALIKSKEELDEFMQDKDPRFYIAELFKTYSREYRLHLTEDGCFYTCRKMLKEDTPAEERWHRHDSNSAWMLEENPLFDKPVNWDAIVDDCVRAIVSVGLDIGCVDLKVQSATDNKGRTRENPEWIVMETNSAPSFGDLTAMKYKEVIPTLLFKRKQNL